MNLKFDAASAAALTTIAGLGAMTIGILNKSELQC
jgi:hypothetical protein